MSLEVVQTLMFIGIALVVLSVLVGVLKAVFTAVSLLGTSIRSAKKR